MRPVLCSLSLWLWVQVCAALTITSISDNGGAVQVGRLVAVVWQDAVGSVNASLISSGQNEAVQTILPLGSKLSLPLSRSVCLRLMLTTTLKLVSNRLSYGRQPRISLAGNITSNYKTKAEILQRSPLLSQFRARAQLPHNPALPLQYVTA